MTCPNCRKKLTVEHLRENAECSKAMASAVGIYSLSKRVTPIKAGPGRPKKKTDIAGVLRTDPAERPNS